MPEHHTSNFKFQLAMVACLPTSICTAAVGRKKASTRCTVATTAKHRATSCFNRSSGGDSCVKGSTVPASRVSRSTASLKASRVAGLCSGAQPGRQRGGWSCRHL